MLIRKGWSLMIMHAQYLPASKGHARRINVTGSCVQLGNVSVRQNPESRSINYGQVYGDVACFSKPVSNLRCSKAKY